MQYTYNWLTVATQRYLLVCADAKLVFVGGPQDGLSVAQKLLRTTAQDEFTQGQIPSAISIGMADLLSGTAQSLPRALQQVTGTAFQQRVYAALNAIPYGQTVTYSDLAQQLAMPRAVRAVAHAVASNPLLVVQPCHRVVPQSGGVGQYRGGSQMKASLIALEAQNVRAKSYN